MPVVETHAPGRFCWADLGTTDPAGPFGGIPFHALADLTLPTWPPDDCPLCAAGGAAEKPGSRE